MKILSCLLFLLALAFPAIATSIEATVPLGTTQCGWYLDSATLPTVVALTTPTTCRFVVTLVSAGTHSITADARAPDPLWGTIISPKAAPFSFIKPGTAGTAPSNFVLVP